MISGMAMELVRIGGLEPDGFLLPEELEYCRDKRSPQQYYAARLAAKKACMKALGRPETISPMEILVRRDDLGKPHLELSGEAGAMADTIGVTRLHLSMTHSKQYAAAVVVLETD